MTTKTKPTRTRTRSQIPPGDEPAPLTREQASDLLENIFDDLNDCMTMATTILAGQTMNDEERYAKGTGRLVQRTIASVKDICGAELAAQMPFNPPEHALYEQIAQMMHAKLKLLVDCVDHIRSHVEYGRQRATKPMGYVIRNADGSYDHTSTTFGYGKTIDSVLLYASEAEAHTAAGEAAGGEETEYTIVPVYL